MDVNANLVAFENPPSPIVIGELESNPIGVRERPINGTINGKEGPNWGEPGGMGRCPGQNLWKTIVLVGLSFGLAETAHIEHNQRRKFAVRLPAGLQDAEAVRGAAVRVSCSGLPRVRPFLPFGCVVQHVKVGPHSGRKNACPLSMLGGPHHSWAGATRGELHPRGPPGGGKHPGAPRCWIRSRGPAPKEGLGCALSPSVIQAGGGLCSDDWGARAFERRPLHRCVQAGSRVTRPVRGASTGAPRGFGHGHARLTAGGPLRLDPQRIASHCGAREVVEPVGCAPDFDLVAEVIEQHRLREASPVAAGVGDGGLARVGRPASANDVERFRCPKRR